MRAETMLSYTQIWKVMNMCNGVIFQIHFHVNVLHLALRSSFSTFTRQYVYVRSVQRVLLNDDALHFVAVEKHSLHVL